MGYFVKKDIMGNEGLILPSGPTSERPDTPIKAAVRYNTDTDSVEYYNGTQFVELAKTGTTDVTIDKFTGDGILTDFTMSIAYTNSEHVLVFLDGIYQTPDDNYFVDGTTISFTSVVPNGIPIRVIHRTANTTVSSLNAVDPALTNILDLMFSKTVDTDFHILLNPDLVDADETFTSDTGQLSYFTTGTPGTTSFTGGTLEIDQSPAGTQNNFVTLNSVTLSVPQFWAEVEVTSDGGSTGFENAGVGIFKDTDNYMFLSMDSNISEFRLQIKIAGSQTFHAQQTVSPPLSYKLGIALVGNSVTMYIDTGSGWVYTSSYDVTSKYDFRTNGNLTGWNPAILAGSAGGNIWNFDNFKFGRHGGVGLRDQVLVTNEDGSTYFKDRNTVMFTASVPDATGKSYCGIFELDLSSYTLTQPGLIFVDRGGKLYDDLIGHIIYYHNGDRRLTMSTWGNGFGGSIQVLHKLDTTEDYLASGSHIATSMTQLNLPQSGTTPGVYDQMLYYNDAESKWKIIYTNTEDTSFSGSPFFASLAESTDLTTWSLVQNDISNQGYEGTKVFYYAGKYWHIAAGIGGGGPYEERVYNNELDFYGELQAAVEGDGNTQPHAAMVPYNDKIIMITHDGIKFGTENFTWGNFLIFEANRFNI